MTPFDSAQARPGMILRGIDPASLLAGRDELELTRLEVQRKLIATGIKRQSFITVNLSGVIIDGNHGAFAAAEAGSEVELEIMDFPFQPSFGPITQLPIAKR
jgi:hypothetical protein